MHPRSIVMPDGADSKATGSGSVRQEKVFSTPPGRFTAQPQRSTLQTELKIPLLLLVDDDDHDAFFFQNALRAADVSLRMTRLRDGQEAIDYFQGRHGFVDRRQFPLPQLVLLDLKMPRRNGFEFLRFIRSLPEFAATLVVILTGSAEEKDIHEAFRLHVAAYLLKPSRVETLIDIARHLEELWLETVLPHKIPHPLS